MQEERCCECDDRTGLAGRSDDSLFYETADGDEIGPLCLECYHSIRSDALGGVQLIVAELTAENARLRRQVERQQECIDNVWEILDETPTINPNNYSYDQIADLSIAIHASLVRIEHFRQRDVILADEPGETE